MATRKALRLLLGPNEGSDIIHRIYSFGFYKYFLFRFRIFGAFTKYNSLALLLILPAAVCIMREPPYKNDCVIFNSVNRPVNSTYKANVFNKFLIFLTNFSVNVYVAINILMNSDTIACGKVPSGKGLYHIETSQLIYSAGQLGGLCMVQVFEKSDFQTIYHVTDFCNILRHIVKSKVIQVFKKLLKYKSVNRSDLINSVYLWLNFSILFSHVFLKSRRDCR